MNYDTLPIRTPDGMTYSDASVTITGSHCIVNGFYSEMYGVSLFAAENCMPHKNGYFSVPSELTVEMNTDPDIMRYIGTDVYGSFGFEPYSESEQTNPLTGESECEYGNYEINSCGTVCISQSGDITVEYSGSTYASFHVDSDKCVTFTCGDCGMISHVRFEAGKPFLYCKENDADDSDGKAYPLTSVIVNTTALSVERSKGRISVSLRYTIFLGNIVIEQANVQISALYKEA